jgi:hypothetical protein
MDGALDSWSKGALFALQRVPFNVNVTHSEMFFNDTDRENIRRILVNQNRTFELLERVYNTENKMAISQSQFDTDLAALITAIGQLITAVDNLPAPTAADFTAEDGQVQAAAAQVAAEINKLNPPTPVTPPATS